MREFLNIDIQGFVYDKNTCSVCGKSDMYKQMCHYISLLVLINKADCWLTIALAEIYVVFFTTSLPFSFVVDDGGADDDDDDLHKYFEYGQMC